MTSTSETVSRDEPEPVADLVAAAERLERAEAAVAEHGEYELQRLAEAYERFAGLLDRYEEPATGDGNFKEFIEFQEAVAETVEGLSEDLLLAEVFEECDEYLQQRRLTESDFAHVRDQLAPVGDLVDRLDERDDALAAYRDARGRVRRRRRELADRVAELERLVELGEADLSAPTERLRDPVEAYNEAVREAFDRARREWPARELLATVDALAGVPMVDYESPPTDLREYVESHEPGAEPVPTLLEYADYSRSKLAHYVADADALKRAVATRQTYLRRLDGEPLTVAWPPPPADRLRFRCRELTGAVDRVAPEVVEALRAVAALPRETDYERLRAAAVAEAELAPDERERVASGAVETELQEVRAERERLAEALETHPER